MALDKVVYVDGETVIYADNLNDIQDEIISNAGKIAENTGDIEDNADDISALQTTATAQGEAISALQSGKVDKVSGKGLSTNDYDNTEKGKVTQAVADIGALQIASAEHTSAISSLQNTKVDKETGKGLSTNDYTTAEKAIVGNVTANLATKVDKVTGKGLSTNDFTNADKDALDNIKTTDTTLAVPGKAADAKAVGDAIDGAVEQIDAQKANVNGYYIDLTSGGAEQLVTDIGVLDKVPYNFRNSGGGADVDTRVDETVVGGTIVWNQIVNTTDTSCTVQSGHVYFSRISGTDSVSQSSGTAFAVDGSADNVIDLTLMLGSDVANYIYGLEQSTAGAGVVWFRRLFPKPYYAYNAGTLESVQTSAHETTGFNQWDEAWEIGQYNDSGEKATANNRIRSVNAISVVAGQTYYFKNASWVFMYSSDGTFLQKAQPVNGLITIPTNVSSIRFMCSTGYGTTYNHDICINLSWDGSRNGEYEPYVKHTYPLDDSLVLRGVPKLDANDRLYFDGDVYAADGTVTRRYGIVDLGTLTWSYDTNNTRFMTTNLNTLVKAPASASIKANFINTKYPAKSFSGTNGYTDKESAFAATGNFFIKDSAYTDAAAFKTAMSGVYLIYELATPTTETADAFVSPQIVDDFGTERYADAAFESGDRDFEVPVGHDSLYQANLKGKLESAPNNPASDGDYIMRRTNGQNAYVSLAQATKLPDPPTNNGTYALKATVSGGTATLAWVSE